MHLIVICALLLGAEAEVRGERPPPERVAFELSASLFASLNQPYLFKTGGLIRGAWRPSRHLAFAARGAGILSFPTRALETSIVGLGNRHLHSIPAGYGTVSVEFSPIVGSLRLDGAEWGVEATLIGGVGAVITESLFRVHPVAELGAALRLRMTRELWVSLEFSNLIYPDVPVGSTVESLEHLLLAGISVGLRL